MTPGQLIVVLSAHLKWLRSEAGGERANLSGAYLNGANLTGANLTGANLTGANLTGANLPPSQVLPEEGEFIAYKKVRNDVVLTLLVPKYATRLTGYGARKSRVSHATPIRAQRNGLELAEIEFSSLYNQEFKYILGEVAAVADFCTDLRVVCAPGIHCYITKNEAEAHS